MMYRKIKIEPSWLALLKDEFEADYMRSLRQFLQAENNAGKVLFPPANEYFSALNLTPFKQVKVVVLGQDPYHGAGQAHGLCFSVSPTIKTPPSLVNIYKELQSDLGIKPATHGCLLSWAQQGVLLLNSVLTVEESKASAHQGKGWEQFTDKIIRVLNEQSEHIVFLLWGSYAHKKGAFIDREKHLVLAAPHPSPLSAYRGFFGSKAFSQTNAYLDAHGVAAINWDLPNISDAIAEYEAAKETIHALFLSPSV